MSAEQAGEIVKEFFESKPFIIIVTVLGVIILIAVTFVCAQLCIREPQAESSTSKFKEEIDVRKQPDNIELTDQPVHLNHQSDPN